MLWVIMAVVEVICAIVAVIYYNVLIRRLLSLLFPKWKLKLPVKILLWVISFALGALSSNLFTTTGVVLVHIMAAALVMELINFIIKKKTKGAPHKYWDIIFKSLLHRSDREKPAGYWVGEWLPDSSDHGFPLRDDFRGGYASGVKEPDGRPGAGSGGVRRRHCG